MEARSSYCNGTLEVSNARKLVLALAAKPLPSYLSELLVIKKKAKKRKAMSRLVRSSRRMRYLGYHWRRVKVIELDCNN